VHALGQGGRSNAHHRPRPLFFTGKGVALEQTLPRPSTALRPVAKNEDHDGWGNSNSGWGNSDDSSSAVASSGSSAPASAKVVASCFVDLARVVAGLGALPKLTAAGDCADLAPAPVSKASAKQPAAVPKAPPKQPQIGAKKKAPAKAPIAVAAPGPAVGEAPSLGAPAPGTTTTTTTKKSKQSKRALSEIISPAGAGAENDASSSSSSSGSGGGSSGGSNSIAVASNVQSRASHLLRRSPGRTALPWPHLLA